MINENEGLAVGTWSLGAVEPTNPKATVKERLDKIVLAMIYQNSPEEMMISLGGKEECKGGLGNVKDNVSKC